MECSDILKSWDEITPCAAETAKRPKGNPGGQRVWLKDIICAFDIETTTFEYMGEKYSEMYIWQFQYGDEATYYGRTWDEYIQFLSILTSSLLNDERIVVFVHNLSYEFQFLKGHFEMENVFAMNPRKILKCVSGKVEYRCSYLLFNMSLDQATKKFHVKHQKLDGELDYSVPRYYYTDLTYNEMQYCINDVRGLVEAVSTLMESESDNIYTLPMTATGYVRRDIKNAVRQSPRYFFKGMELDYHTYQLLHSAFRGGNTHANRHYTGLILNNVGSFDRSSSYPDVLCNCKFPIGAFQKEEENEHRLIKLMDIRKRAILIKVKFIHIALKNDYVPVPYLSTAKCEGIVDGDYDNGRILSARELFSTFTDIDFEIICSQYSFDRMDIIELYSCRYDYLPHKVVEQIQSYYVAKTQLKGIAEQAILYEKSKNKINAVYGLSAQNPLRVPYAYNGLTIEIEHYEPEEQLRKYKGVMPYAWGVWCTAWARYRLQEGIELAGDNMIYCDTDSVKYIGSIELDKYNALRRADSKRSGSYAKDSKGKTHYMGVYEYEGMYDRFRTWGAKKYAYEQDGELHCVVSGVAKYAKGGNPSGAEELQAAGGLEAFKENFVFRKSAGIEPTYHDLDCQLMVKNPDGVDLLIGSNVAFTPSTYTLGITEEYAQLLSRYQFYKEAGII